MKIEDARGRYVVFCKGTFPNRLSLDGIKMVVDAGHGAAYVVAPAVFTELGADVLALGDQAQRQEHQPRRRRAPPRARRARRWCAAAPRSASRSTATPTA